MARLTTIITTAIFFLMLSPTLFAQDFMMQGWYWDYPKTADGHTWADTLEAKATELGNAGFTYVWLPPLSAPSFGNGSNGYDPKDLFDLGEFNGPTGFGTRTDVDEVIAALGVNGIEAVADVVYNHRDGGKVEANPAVEGWIENYACFKVDGGDAVFPSDRFGMYLPLGGASGNGAGTYYFKIRSASTHPNFYNSGYKIYTETNTIGWQNLPDDTNEAEPNGGGDCGQGSKVISLGRNFEASIDDIGGCGNFCGIDEFELTISASDFDTMGDTLWIYLGNTGGYADQYIHGLWSAALGQDIQSQITYFTFTDFNSMPSGRGGMDWQCFKPNGNPTQLTGDLDGLWFFYDIDQSNQATTDTLYEWTKWLWEDVGIRGYRMDAVKHFPADFTGNMLDFMHNSGYNPGMVVGEFFDFNAFTLKGWIDDVEATMNPATIAAIDVRIFDFALRGALKNACDAFGYDVRDVFNAGMVNEAGAHAYSVVTFLNNHDFREEGQPVENDPMLAYAYLFTNNQIGLPTVFYADYYGSPVPHYTGVALKNEIDQLMAIHQDHIFGSSNIDYLSRHFTPYTQNFTSGLHSTTMAYQMSGGSSGKDIVVFINFAGDPLVMSHGVNTSSMNLQVGDMLIDKTGNATTNIVTVDGNSELQIEIPARSYAVFVACDPCTGARAKAKLILEGAYNATSGEMSTDLRTANLLPLTQPFNQNPWNYTGTESVAMAGDIPANIVDWVLLEVRDAIDNSLILDSRAAFLRNDGSVVDLDGSEGVEFANITANQSYYLVARHRNHLAVLSANTVELPNVTPYDFSLPTNVSSGATQVKELNNGIYGILAGDISGDGIISVADFNIYTTQASMINSYELGDLNLDKSVTVTDFNFYLPNSSVIGVSQVRY